MLVNKPGTVTTDMVLTATILNNVTAGTAAAQRLVAAYRAEDRPAVGKALTDLRTSLSLSRMEFGKVLGVAHITVGRWERNDTRFGAAQMLMLMLGMLGSTPQGFIKLYDLCSRTPDEREFAMSLGKLLEAGVTVL